MTNKTHKHAELIKAWADGEQIQLWINHTNQWEDVKSPMWCEDRQYRIKPQPVVQKMYMHYDDVERAISKGNYNYMDVPQKMFNRVEAMSNHLEFTFTDGKLTKVEMKHATY